MPDANPGFSRPAAPEPQQNRVRAALLLFALLLSSITFLNIVARPNLPATWWANFVFAPAVLLLVGAQMVWHHTPRAWHLFSHLMLSIGIIVFTLATILLFRVIGFGWTLLVLIPGLALTVHSITIARTITSPELHAWLRASAWSGSVGAVTGLVLLLIRLDVLALQHVIGTFQWWSIIISAIGVGIVWNAWWLYHKVQQRLTLSVWVLGGFGLLTCISGLLEALNIT